MTWPGAPTIYYGDEVGVCGWTDPDSRRTFPWGHEDMELLNFHKEMIRIHKRYKSLLTGSLKFIHGEYKCIAYGRFNSKEAVLVVLNNDYSDKTLRLHVRELGVYNNRNMKRIMLTTEEGYIQDDQTNVVQNNVLTITMPKISAAIYVCKF